LNIRAYIDGFNLYYSFVRNHNARWIDLRRFIERSFPGDVVEAVNFYTAIVTKTPQDPSKPKRQLAYRDALLATGVDVHLGQFTRHKNWATLVNGSKAQIYKIQEKGSDVNLASHLLLDASKGRYDMAVVMTNDSDLATLIALVQKEFGLPVTVLAPVDKPTHASQTLLKIASKSRLMDVSLFASCALPDPVDGPGGSIRRPPGW
jgi:uncharacterized LabA/DUF88 family protein